MPKQPILPFFTDDEHNKFTVRLADLEHPDNGIKAKLDEHGFCIVSGAIADEECVRLETVLQQDLEEVFGPAVSSCETDSMTAEDKLNAWPKESLHQLGHLGKLENCGVPQGRFAWSCRRAPGVVRAFQVIHGTDELVSSCEAPVLINASSASGISARRNGSWPHIDFNHHRSDMTANDKSEQVYLGLLYVWPTTLQQNKTAASSAPSSNMVVWPKSHKPEVYENYLQDTKLRDRGAQGAHVTPICSMTDGTSKEQMMQGWQTHARKVVVPRGGLLIWSSRLTHQGCGCGAARLVQPVSWIPRRSNSNATAEEAEERLQVLAMAASGIGFAHWKALGMSRDYPLQKLGKLQDKPEGFVRSQVLKSGVDAIELLHHLTNTSLGNCGGFLEDSLAGEYRNALA